MISVTVGLFEDEYIFAADGHAKYNPGNDIVCAGVSSLAYALLGYLHNHEDDISAKEMTSESGKIRIRITSNNALLPAFETVVIGVMQIAKKYPKNVEVYFKKNITDS